LLFFQNIAGINQMNFKQSIYSAALILIIVLSFSNCKKGQDDPIISLKSRKARLTGVWTLMGGSFQVNTMDINKWQRINQTYSFTGSTYVLSTTDQALAPVISSGIFTLKMGIDELGNFTLHENIDGYKLSATGTWDFNAGSASEKKKESVIFSLQHTFNGQGLQDHLFNREASLFTYRIKELRDKKLVLSGEGLLSNSADGSTETYIAEFIFTQRE
jgi:hypothetical protein